MLHLIYLAAGFGSRFGSNKLLYELDGLPMYRHVLDRLVLLAEESPEDMDLVIVTQYPEILDMAGENGIPSVINPDPARGISSSLQTGIRYLDGKGLLHPDDRLVFFQADQPYLPESLIRGFLRAVRDTDACCCACSVNGQPVSPCAFSAALLPELMALQGDRGGKSVLLGHLDSCLLFEAECAEHLEDIDSL